MRLYTLSQFATEMNLTREEASFALIQNNYYYFFTEKGIRIAKIKKEDFWKKTQTN